MCLFIFVRPSLSFMLLFLYIWSFNYLNFVASRWVVYIAFFICFDKCFFPHCVDLTLFFFIIIKFETGNEEVEQLSWKNKTKSISIYKQRQKSILEMKGVFLIIVPPNTNHYTPSVIFTCSVGLFVLFITQL